jgi:NitT/TauT family transport system ATP-binding protein
LDAQTREILQDELLRIYQRGTSDAAGRKAPPAMVFITHSIEESIALGDRVVVLSARPAIVREVLSIDIPRPRTVASVIAHPRFVELRDRCWRLLRERAA